MSYDSEVLADSPLAYWKMTGLTVGTANVPDSSGNGRNATFQDANAGWTPGAAGIFPALSESVTWAGTSGKYIFHSISPNTTTYSVEMCLRLTSLAKPGLWDQDTGARSVTVASDGTLSFDAGPATFSSSTGAIAINTSYHLVITYNSTTGAVTGWLNGTQVITGTTSTGLTDGFAIRWPWTITNGNEAIGNLSHHVLYSTVLSPTRIAAHYAVLLVVPVDVFAPPMILPALLEPSPASFPPPVIVSAPPLLVPAMLLPAPASFPAPISIAAPPMLAAALFMPPTVVVPVRSPVGAFTVDPSQGWGFDIGTLITLSPIEPDDGPGPRRIIRTSETYPNPVLVNGRPT